MEKSISSTYDFSKGKRGSVVPIPSGKTRITIRLDNEVLDWFRSRVDEKGGGSYQTMINDALKEYVRRGGEPLESFIRRIMKDELTSILETAHLLRSPKNIKRLLSALERVRKEPVIPQNIDDLRKEVGLE